MSFKLEESIWFERKFAPISDNLLIPNIMERLSGTPTRIAQKVRKCSTRSLEEREMDKWSVKEEIGHLTDLEELWIGRILDFMEEREVLRKADLTNEKTHFANHNQHSVERLIKYFTTQRARLINSIELLEDDDLTRTCLHPRLKTPMRVVDLLFFIAEHDDHHLARMTRRIEQAGQ